MPVALAGQAISAATTIGGGLLQAGAASNAAKVARDTTADTNAFAKGVYNTASGNLSPYIANGGAASGELAGLLGIGGNPTASANAFNNYLDSTNYKFTLNQGLQGIQYANAPAFASSGTAKALNNYAQGQAGNALGAYEGLLQGQSALGAQSAIGLGGIGTQAGGIVNSANQALASQVGGAGVYGATAGANALSGLGSIANTALTGSSFGKGLFGGGGGGSSTTGGAYAQFSDLLG